jgi:integrase/recombinase XerD
VKSEIRLLPEQTKGRHARTVFLNEKLRHELQEYANQLVIKDHNYAFENNLIDDQLNDIQANN